MKKKNLYLGLGALALVGLGIYAYANRTKLPEVKDIKVSADGSSDEERGNVEKLPSQKKKQEKSNVGGMHGGGGHWHGGGFGGRRRFFGYPIGWGYPYWADGGLCYMRDRYGRIVSYYCNPYSYPY